MSSLWSLALVACILLALVQADVYMHNPRGSNDRNRETSTNRDNAQRLFDSQNNGKGGYCWGPPLYYYEGSIVAVEWTSQHACGPSNPNDKCEIIIQYYCAEDVRDGLVTTTIPEDATANDTQDVTDECWFTNGGYNCSYPATEPSQHTWVYGMHENYVYWNNCDTRLRNGGLFKADQNPGPNARNTRQNPGGTRHGYECAEERDYYPYWHPTPWKDIAILTDDVDRCSYYRRESQNVKAKNYCLNQRYNNEKDCVGNNELWLEAPSHDIDPPECVMTFENRDNHLGNNPSGFANTYNWTVPYDASDDRWCVLRIRYNISTTDYDGWTTDASSNAPPKSRSPVTNDPYIEFGTVQHDEARMGDSMNLSLAINTAQFGRTFQDRSHTFQIRERPGGIPELAKVYNINVRGKRGNIVQVYPAVEYDFVPNRLHVYLGDYVHFQWTGCDHNPQGNDGEGRAGTDRSNVVLLKSAGGNYFKPIEDNDLFDSFDDTYNMAHLEQNETLCLNFSQLEAKHGNQNDRDQDPQNCMKLNPAGRYYDGGLLRIQSRHVGTSYAYMSTRNNNFSNRSQKGYLIVGSSASIPRWLIAIITALSFGVICLVVVPVGLLIPTVAVVLGNALAQRL